MGAALKVGYIEGAIDATPMGNAYAFSGTTFGWLYPRHVSFPARQCRPLLVVLNAGQCKCLLRDLARLLFDKEGFGELLEDNSSSVGAFASSGIMGFFPLSRTIRYFACSPSYASPSPRSCLFFTGSETIIFTLQVLSMILKFPHLPCLFLLLLLHILTLMKELVLGQLNHRIAQHCKSVKRTRCREGNRWSYWWRRAIRKPLEPRSCTSSMMLFVQFPQMAPVTPRNIP